MHIARVGERLPRLQIQFRISRSFRPRNLANLGSKIRLWIRRKEHTLSFVYPKLERLSLVARAKILNPESKGKYFKSQLQFSD